ncbi:MAG TPA: SpaH/EbpB family LPXTG-anchored major pilin [Pseudogracilibacillus sp.]|nr:SpaH/EbpB family LPXTG-anchored major pilin [Pseudogracilibacillus sp.]
MTKKITIYHFLIALMIFSLVLPAGLTGATASNSEGSLTIHKFSQPTGTDPGEPGNGSILDPNPDGTPVEGVTYTITQTHEFNEPGDWSEVSGAPFTMVTGADGTISKDLSLGRYTVKETSGPADLNLNPKEFTIEIPMTDVSGETNNYDVHIYPKNEEIRGAVQLTKIDGKTEAKLPGVKFDLFDPSGVKVDGSPFTTNSNGQINIEGLKIGSYTFSEVATIDGYVLGGDIEFTITKSGTVKADGTSTGDLVEVTATNYQEPGVEKEVDKSAVNRGEEVTYTINVDLPADIKDYKNFVVKDKLHPNLEFVSAETVPGFTFTQNGQNLEWTGTPADLTSGSLDITFKAKVSEDAVANEAIPNKATIDYTNQHDTDGDKETEPVDITPTVGGLTVIKQDGNTEDKLSGAVFELHDKQGNTVGSAQTTDGSGKINFGELNYGDYRLVEIKAPNGYKKLRNPIDVTIDKDNSIQTITVDNYESGWELPKTGGIGTIIFTVIGLIFMGIAIYLYIRRKRLAIKNS